jgi:hypothetical protein
MNNFRKWEMGSGQWGAGAFPLPISHYPLPK